MSHKYLRPILINLFILVIIFSAFIFIDVNASTPPLHEEKTNSQYIPRTIHNFADTPVYEWSAAHYKQKNSLNPETNTLALRISDTETRNIAFFSRQTAYYRFEIARFVVRGIDPQRCRVTVHQADEALPAYEGPTSLSLHRLEGDYTASWFYDWHTPVSRYSAVLWIDGKALARTYFSYIRRDPVKFNRSYALMNLEFPIYEKSIKTPDAEEVTFNEGLKSWMDYGEMDGFLMLGGQTSGYDRVDAQNPWASPHFRNVERIGKEIHDQGKLFGAYIMCFYTPAQGWEKAGYASAMGVSRGNNGTVHTSTSKFTSFTDPKRFNDIVALARHFNSLPYVDMIGFDFIRFGENVGYENAEEFAIDMNIALPANWKDYSQAQKIVWMSQIMKKSSTVKQWRLWKAHKTADFVYRVIREAGLTKPTWVFTLGWDHGSEHGQDPIMFQDAGVLADFVMLYEASPQMFQAMNKQWGDYLAREKVNYIPGNQIDSVVNKSLGDRNPVEEYYYRLTQGASYAPYLSRGVFIHDIHRAFFSKRRQGYSYYEWLMTGLASASYHRFKNAEIPFSVEFPEKTFYYSDSDKSIDIPYTISFVPEKLSGIQGSTLNIEGPHKSFTKKLDIKGQTNVTLYIRVNPREKGSQYMALKANVEGYPSYFTFRYFNFKKKTP